VVSNLNNIGPQSAFAAPTALPGQSPLAAAALPLANPQAMASMFNPLAGYGNAMSNISSSISMMIANTIRRFSTPAAPSTTQRSTATGGGAGRPKIVQIDDFSTDRNGFNHGQEIAKTLNSDGNVDLQQYDVSRGGNRLTNISNALDDVIARVQNGETVDAINISLQDLDNSPISQQIRNKIDQLSSLGVPVAVAAGNGGPGARNALTTNTSFNVASTTNGVRNNNSGVGNVQAEGRTTSFATANLARQLAEKHAQGYTSGQLLNIMA
jgi:hypothetical protein